MKELRDAAKTGWMLDCDFDEAMGNEGYQSPIVYASEKLLVDANPDAKDVDCHVYPQRVYVFDADEFDIALAATPAPQSSAKDVPDVKKLAFDLVNTLNEQCVLIDLEGKNIGFDPDDAYQVAEEFIQKNLAAAPKSTPAPAEPPEME